MNLDQIKKEMPEIAKMIYDEYPVSKRERTGCVSEKMTNDYLRIKLAKKLIQESKEKKEYGNK